MTQSLSAPFFYDVTLRDGNQALKKPWNIEQKEQVFHKLLQLGVQGIEVGYPGASELDFKACQYLAKLAPDNVSIAGLARAVEKDIDQAWEALKNSSSPRIHTFLTTSPYNMEHVLQKTPNEVLKIAVNAVKHCHQIMGGRGSIEFSAEHFGDCLENLDFVIELLMAVVEQGATVINLPNTVERYRPSVFVDGVRKVVQAFDNYPQVKVSVHCHNDLGMATATTVESFFAGAIQLETTLNGLGERAGNTNMYEVACALYNCQVPVNLKMEAIYETAIAMQQLSGIEIPEKAPLIGADVVAHRSGIHQDGATKTKGQNKGAYRSIAMSLIGRKTDDYLGFTSQSGKTAVFEIVKSQGLPFTLEEAAFLQPILKKKSEEVGELSVDAILKEYDRYVLSVQGDLQFKNFQVNEITKNYQFEIVYQSQTKSIKAEGEGPVEAFCKALQSMGLFFDLVYYKQESFDAEHKHYAAYAISEIQLKDQNSGKVVIGRAKDTDTVIANFKAICNGVNLILNG